MTSKRDDAHTTEIYQHQDMEKIWRPVLGTLEREKACRNVRGRLVSVTKNVVLYFCTEGDLVHRSLGQLPQMRRIEYKRTTTESFGFYYSQSPSPFSD
jgi:hypothetical protein